ncbi:hypothetical protein ACFU76_12615 [Streptomyces sp. NPDC057539]|uniref:hypothetical protein n=1 Tax=Streptomyces sp. NPDC057539 TaxID=3346159 RepID=UPI0036C330E0
MGLEEHQELLQSVAVWLVRAGRAQLSHQDAERQIELATRRLPQVSAQGSPATVLTYLLNRSSLLQERGDKALQFIHRTLQGHIRWRRRKGSPHWGLMYCPSFRLRPGSIR